MSPRSENLQRGNPLSSIKKSSPAQTSTVSFPTSSVPITKKAKSHLHKVHKTSDHRVSRKKRAAAVDPEASVVQKYDLTDKNIVSRLQLSPDQVASCQKSVNNLKKAISRYGGLRNKNSRIGQRLLVDQSRFVEEIHKKLHLPKDHKAFEVMSMIKNEYKSHRVKVEKFIHGIWVAGAPPDGTDAYIKTFLSAYDDFQFQLWVDNKAYGAAKFTSILKK